MRNWIRHCVRLIAVACWVLSSSPARGDGSEPEVSATCRSLAEQVQQHYEQVRDLRFRFTQTRRSVTFGGSALTSEAEARGQAVLAKPGKMRWTYHAPRPSIFVSDGDVAWTYDPEFQEAQRMQGAGGLVSGAALQFLLGEGKLLEEFEVSGACRCQPDPGAAGECQAPMQLVPRQDASFERLELGVDPKTGEVRATSVTDLLGNRTQLELADVEVNLDPPESTFQFSPPDGTQVMEFPLVNPE